MAASSFLSACGGSSGSAASPPVSTPNTQPVPAGPLTVASVAVGSVAGGTIGPNFAGFSYDKSEMDHPLFSASNTNLLGLFKLIGPSLLRMGGDGADQLTWTPDGPGQTYPTIAESDVNSWAAFVKASGWQVLYAVNLGGSALPAGTPGYTTPALAAAEVAYVAGQLGPLLYGIEIGNEPDSYGRVGRYYACNWSLAQYEALWAEYRSAILATTPGLLITGPAGGHLAAWTIPFSETETKNNLGLVTDHYYKLSGAYPPTVGCDGTPGSGGPAPTIAELVDYPDMTLTSNLGLLAAAQQITGIPYRLGETNSVASNGAAGVSDTYASALWIIDHLFTCALGGATGVNLTTGHNAYYSPVNDDETNVLSVQNEFYGILMFVLAGQGSLYQTQVSASSLNVSAFAVKNSAGDWSIVVNNKDQTANLQLTLTLPESVTSATLIAMTQLSAEGTTPDLSATSGATIQSAAVSIDGSFSPAAAYSLTVSGAQVTCYVPALSAVLIHSH